MRASHACTHRHAAENTRQEACAMTCGTPSQHMRTLTACALLCSIPHTLCCDTRAHSGTHTRVYMYVHSHSSHAQTQLGYMHHSVDRAPVCVRAFGMHPCCVLASCVNAYVCVRATVRVCVPEAYHVRARATTPTPYRNYGRRCHEVSSAARTWSAHRRGVRCMCVYHEHTYAHCWSLTM